MKPLYLMTPDERDEIAKKFLNIHKRPDTDDWEFWNAIAEIDRLKDDCERSKTTPEQKEMNPNTEHVILKE